MDRDAIFEKVVEVVEDTLSLGEGTQLTEATEFKSLGADSFDLLELVTAIEDEFGLTMDDEAVSRVATIGQVVDAIEAAQ
ncbi:phosphopantetheine-binding protein [Olsenella sp. An290]|uniref:phosphopantetheine-binding protein n=1 Tax=Olsenella sp. An290 TaxID=1965625 RepID=UPI000B375AD7|nr:phosphopantetheine-binding protein [Olsenella sp. An290]OUO35542.1 phosphopantetheine-binding protein [Olsenella sp. An290]